MKIRYKKMHNILSYSKLIQQAFDEAIKNYIKANTILINRNLAYFPGEDVCIGDHVCELPPMIMGLEAYVVNDLPEDCEFAVCRKEKTEREQLEEEVRKETAKKIIYRLRNLSHVGHLRSELDLLCREYCIEENKE